MNHLTRFSVLRSIGIITLAGGLAGAYAGDEPKERQMTANTGPRMTIETLKPLVRKYAFQARPKLNPAVHFKIEEFDVSRLWDALRYNCSWSAICCLTDSNSTKSR